MEAVAGSLRGLPPALPPRGQHLAAGPEMTGPSASAPSTLPFPPKSLLGPAGQGTGRPSPGSSPSPPKGWPVSCRRAFQEGGGQIAKGQLPALPPRGRTWSGSSQTFPLAPSPTWPGLTGAFAARPAGEWASLPPAARLHSPPSAARSRWASSWARVLAGRCLAPPPHSQSAGLLVLGLWQRPEH